MQGDDLRRAVLPLAVAHTGYERRDVDALLEEVARGLDAQQPVAPLIDSATFKVSGSGYDRDVVDTFLFALSRTADSGMITTADNYASRFLSDNGDWTAFEAGEGVKLLRHGRILRPHLLFGPAGELLATYRFRTAELPVGNSSFKLQPLQPDRASDPATIEWVRRSHQSTAGWHASPPGKGRAATAHSGELRRGELSGFLELVDQSDTTVCRLTPPHGYRRATRMVMFPDGGWLRFPVTGSPRHGIMLDLSCVMTAVDQTGTQIARFKRTRRRNLKTCVALNPACRLTDTLKAVLVIVGGDLGPYCIDPSSPANT